MALFEVTAYDRQVYEEQLKDFLPDRIFDIHTHVYHNDLRDVQPDPKNLKWTARVARHDPIEDLQETFRLLFPGKDVKALMFDNGTGAKNDAYVAKCSAETGWPALHWSKPQETAEELEQTIRNGGFLGIKPYLCEAPSYIPVKEVRILDFLPEHHLEVLNKMGGIAMLHIPRDGRLKDPVNLHQIVEIKKGFPNVKLIVAHVGRAYCQEDVGDAFELLDQCPDLLYDFSANCCDYAITEVIRHAGVKNVMYGTDMPILRMRTHRIVENGNYVNLVPPGLYGDISKDPHMREVTAEEAEKITFFVYEELLSFKRSAEKLGLSKEDVADIMYGNAERLIAEVRQSIYGK